jgi:hypothetical protein
MKTIAAWFLFGLLTFTAARSWLDYVSSVPMPGQVQSVRRGWQGEHRTRDYDFGVCRYEVVDRDPALGTLLELAGAGTPELDGVLEGNRVTLWTSLASGRATPALRMPIVTTILPLLYVALLLVDRGVPVPNRGVRRVPHLCLGCIFLECLLLLGIFAGLILIGYGLVAPLLEGEHTLREGLVFPAIILLLSPVITLGCWLDRRKPRATSSSPGRGG